MAGQLCPEPSPELMHRRWELAPDTQAAFGAFGRQVFALGVLDTKTEQLIAVAVTHVTQCPIASKSTARPHSGPGQRRRS